MSELTREQIEAWKEFDSGRLLPNVRRELIALCDMALASLSRPSEAVAWIEHHKGGDNLVWEQTREKCTPLYLHPARPVSEEQASSSGTFAQGVEAAAKVCDERSALYMHEARQAVYAEINTRCVGFADGAAECADAIRALSPTQAAQADTPNRAKLSSLRGMAAGALGGRSSEQIVNESRDEWAAQAQAVECRPKIVCLCGSSRFVAEMACIAWALERDEGVITLGLHLLPADYPNVAPDHMAEHEGFKEHFDELHKRKIDLADEILVVNIGGYIGESTRSEIDYAIAHNKPVKYLEKP